MPSGLEHLLESAPATKCLELGSGALARTPDIFARFFAGKSALVVADPTTFAVAGQRVLEALRNTGQPSANPFIFTDANFYADHQFVTLLEQRLSERPGVVPIAVGSGTINDVTKLAAHRAHRGYVTVATAASMDGYTAFGASITHNGSKQTFACDAPVAVVADLEVIGTAPADLNAAGYADLLAKVTAGADWILADALDVESIHPKAWELVQGNLHRAVANPSGVRAQDPQALGLLTEGLMLSGFAMQFANSSRPASGAEHQFSHLWDMQHHTHQGTVPLHGFKVGIGTLVVGALYEYVLAQPLETIDVDACCQRWPSMASREQTIRDLFGNTPLTEVALRENQAKHADAVALRRQLTTLRRIWPELRERLRQQLLPFVQLKARLQAAGAPVQPQQIGLTSQRLQDSFREACFIRRRFTVFDLALRTGLLENALDQLFAPSGLWPLVGPVP